MKDLILSYILCALGLISPLAGLHRFYLKKPASGVLYLFTWGFFGIGTIIDLVRMPNMVEAFRRKELSLQEHTWPRLSSPERAILKCAQNHHGTVTIQMVALESGLTMSAAKLELDKLYRQDFCNKDVDEDGNEIFIFKGLNAKKPLV